MPDCGVEVDVEPDVPEVVEPVVELDPLVEEPLLPVRRPRACEEAPVVLPLDPVALVPVEEVVEPSVLVEPLIVGSAAVEPPMVEPPIVGLPVVEPPIVPPIVPVELVEPV